jgi:curved DNA-binding protein CbpA
MPLVDHYATLGVSPSAKEEEIKLAWRAKAKELHPDRNPSPAASRLFSEAKEAYDVLSSPESRRRYDAERFFGTQSHTSPPPPPASSSGNRWTHAERAREEREANEYYRRATKEREREPDWWDDLFRRTSGDVYRAPRREDPWTSVVDYGMEQDILEDSYGQKFVFDRHGVPRLVRDGSKNGFRSKFRNGGKVG